MTAPTGSKTDTDLLLADLFEQVTGKLQAGEPLDVDAYAADHPQCAEQFRELLPTLEFLVDLNSVASRGGSSAHGLSAADSSVPARGILGDFQILGEIGRGGMGIVYQAEQISLDRRVALKVLPFAAVLDPKHLQRFKNEARAAASLDHPNIVHVHSVGCDRAVHFYAMQYIEGQTLAEVIREGLGVRGEGIGEGGERVTGRRGDKVTTPTPSDSPPSPSPLSPPPPDTSPLAALSTEASPRSPKFFRTVARLGIQAAEALEHAHGLGVVHRDIKPSNLMVESRLPSPAHGRGAGGEGPHLWITDFGLAMTQTDTNLTMTGDLLGTLRYMSPEQVQAKHGVLDHRTDVYSLGLTLYELLTLRPAFPGDDRQKLLRQVAENEPPAPRQINHAIPRDLETIVLKAIAKEPDGRYATAQELADDLRRFVEDQPIQGRRPSLMERSAKWLRRRPSVVVSSALLLVVAVIALSVSTLLITAEQRKTTAALADREAALSTAEANVRLAAEAVEKMLTRNSQDAVFHGHVEHAETLMVDAVDMFQTLLRRSDDPMLRYRAAQAYNTAGNIQRLLGRYEESQSTYQQAVVLLDELAEQFPDNRDYRESLADSHNGVGMALFYLLRIQEAEDPFNIALKIREELAARFPDQARPQMALADALGNLGQVYRETGRLDLAERNCRRVLSILDQLPRECRLGPEGFARSGAAHGNLGLVLRDRGDFQEAEKLLEKGYWLHTFADGRSPGNPTYTSGLYNGVWNQADLFVRQGSHDRAAQHVDHVINLFPNRLQAYAEGVGILLRCAETAAQGAEAAKAAEYKRRAGELLKQSAQAADKPPYPANDLAWHLATWPDETFRDATRAVALAEHAVRATPENTNHWNTLGVARYRAGNWKAAVEALDKSMKLASGGNALDWLTLAMAQHQLRNHEEARQWYDKAVKWMDENDREDEQLHRFRNEAAELLGAEQGTTRPEQSQPVETPKDVEKLEAARNSEGDTAQQK